MTPSDGQTDARLCRAETRMDDMKNTMSNVPGLLDDQPVVFDFIEIEQHYETAYSDLPELDPDWRYVDEQGHGHFVADDNANRLPTLEWVVTRTYWCEECRDEHDEGEYRCRFCAEVIEPGKRPNSGPIRIPTYKSFAANLNGPDVPTEDREYVIKVGRDAYVCRIAEGTYSSSGGSVTLRGGPQVVRNA